MRAISPVYLALTASIMISGQPAHADEAISPCEMLLSTYAPGGNISTLIFINGDQGETGASPGIKGEVIAPLAKPLCKHEQKPVFKFTGGTQF